MNTSKNKKKLRYLFKSLLLIFLLSPLLDLIPGNNYLHIKDKPNKCGIVIDKMKPANLHIGKYSGNLTVEQVLVVDYGGTIINETVGPSSFYNSEIGERICFELSNHESAMKQGIFLTFIIFFAGFVDLLLILWYFIGFILSVFSDDKVKE